VRIDVNCCVGQWPFRKMYKHSFADLVDVHRRNGIDYGYVSSLHSIFYNDPFEGEEELHEWIKDSNYGHILTVNPDLPGWEDDIERGVKLFGIRGVKIVPTYHGYDLNKAAPLCAALERYGLPLFLPLRMQDDRLNYLFAPQLLSVDEVEQFCKAHTAVRIVLLNIRYHEVLALKSLFNEYDHVRFDTSGLKDYLFVVEKLLLEVPATAMLYGSLYPLYCLRSTWLLVEDAEIGEERKQRIRYENARALFSLNQA